MDLLIDPVTNDLATENGEVKKVEGIEEIRQRVRLTFRALRGEYHLDTGFGFPYLQVFAEKDPNLDAISAICRAVAMSITGIKRVLSVELSFDHEERKLTGFIRLETDVGETEVEI